MNRKTENGLLGLTNPSEHDLEVFVSEAKRLLVESELEARWMALMIDQMTEEKEFRRSGKPKRRPEEWRKLWFEHVNAVATAHKMDLNVAGEIARRIEAVLQHDFNLQFRKERETS